PRRSGAEIEFPAVPGASEDLARSARLVVARRCAFQRAPELARTQGAGLVRAAVEQREVFAVDVEDADGAPCDLDDLAPAGRNLARLGDDVLGHDRAGGSASP